MHTILRPLTFARPLKSSGLHLWGPVHPAKTTFAKLASRSNSL